MAYETKDMSGSLWPNKEKQSDNHPDFKGTVKIGGVEMWINGWRKRTKNGDQYLSVSFREKGDPGSRPAAKAELDDEIPF